MHGKSNLLEGSEVSGYIDIPDYVTIGYSDTTRVNPDGSFDLRINYPKDKKNMFVEIKFSPDEHEWQNVIENYGEKEEKLAGKYVKTEGNGNKEIVVRLKLNE